MATVQTLKDFREQMGLKGTDLRDFITEHEDLEREERNRLTEEQVKQRAEQDRQRESEKSSGNMIGYSKTSRENLKRNCGSIRKKRTKRTVNLR